MGTSTSWRSACAVFGPVLLLAAALRSAPLDPSQGPQDPGPAPLSQLADEFERARLGADHAALRALATPNATAFSERGGELAALGATWREGLVEAPASARGRLAPTTVVQRRVARDGRTASVCELLRANGAAAAPVRRTLTCVEGEDGWRITHLHVSPYTRWRDEIEAFERQDASAPPEAGGIVFVGSSSIRRWDSLESDFADLPVIERGFGGSQMLDSALFAHRIVTPYRPRMVVVYAGDNDIAAGKGPQEVLDDYLAFIAAVHGVLPEAKIAFIAIKPSLARWKLWPEMREANRMVADLAAGDPRLTYLDIASPMLGTDGAPRPELFVADGLHLSPAGYALWAATIRPALD
ncbi:MAG: SGNH/GDSL hydrolase family protein [Planctomycetota bacterium]